MNSFNKPGIDAQMSEIRQLTKKEKAALKLRADGATFEAIKNKLFPKLSKQAVWDLIQKAEQKVWRHGAKQRYAVNPGDCPIDELPLPARIRNALKNAGYTRIGELAGKTVAELSQVKGPYEAGKPRGLKKVSAIMVSKLIEDWGLRRANSFCPNCGAPLNRRLNGKPVTMKCKRCGRVAEVQNVPEKAAAVA